jgi:phosphoserine phosphatase RsbU/P
MHRDSFGGRPSGRPVVGLLVDWLKDSYQNTLVSGVADAARELGVDLVCFTGGVLRSPYPFAAQRNAIYDLAGPENVDGLLIMSGTLGNTIGPDELARWCERYRPLPMCSIAVPLPGIPSVLVDNATGMADRGARLSAHRVHPRAGGQRRVRATLSCLSRRPRRTRSHARPTPRSGRRLPARRERRGDRAALR